MMLNTTKSRAVHAARQLSRPCTRSFTTTARRPAGENLIQANDPSPKNPPPNVSATNAVATKKTTAIPGELQELPEEGERQRQMQAPNRDSVWAPSQRPRDLAMSGPRFEQTIIEYQPQPYSAIELIHKQPVRWTHQRVVSCDGGGGPLGHPRIFINTDKPQICACTYCGLPFANEHHRDYLKSLPHTSYPLEPLGDPAEVSESQKVTDEPLAQR